MSCTSSCPVMLRGLLSANVHELVFTSDMSCGGRGGTVKAGVVLSDSFCRFCAWSTSSAHEVDRVNGGTDSSIGVSASWSLERVTEGVLFVGEALDTALDVSIEIELRGVGLTGGEVMVLELCIASSDLRRSLIRSGERR